MPSGRRLILTAGFAMFSMFFGSGNLVFPLLIGRNTLGQSDIATLGLILTAVIVPCLGLLGMILFDGDYNKFFARLGKIPAFMLIFVMFSLLGPFGVVPRCITVAFGGVGMLFPHLPQALFSLGFCALVGALIWQRNKVVDIIGLVLTPFKLGGIMLMVLIGLWYGQPSVPTNISTLKAFTEGVFKGYQTMDLIAAFFFSSTTVYYMRMNLPHQDAKTLFKYSAISSLIGAGLLSIAYTGFVRLGAQYAPLLMDVNPEELLATVAFHSMGSLALPVVSITMAVACLATAVILSSLFVDFLQNDLLGNRINHGVSVVISLLITFCMSQLGFAKICDILGSLLELAYPALIALAIMNIINQDPKARWTTIPFWIILGGSILYKII